MTLEYTRLIDAQLDRDRVSKCREVLRDALLMGLSECRTIMIGMAVEYQARFLDDITKGFHPDGQVSDVFNDAFCDTEDALDRRIEDCEAEVLNPLRVPMRAAAE